MAHNVYDTLVERGLIAQCTNAEEVRKLAEECSQAVQSTSCLIEASIKSVEKGKSIADSASRSLEEVVDSTETTEETVVENVETQNSTEVQSETESEFTSKEDNKEEEEKDNEDGNEDEDDKEEKYSLLEKEYNTLQSQFADLQSKYDELVAFKASIEDKEKDALINKFYMLSDEDKADVIANKAKYTLEKIEKYLNLFDYKLISAKYINANLPIKVMCPEGHIFEIRF